MSSLNARHGLSTVHVTKSERKRLAQSLRNQWAFEGRPGQPDDDDYIHHINEFKRQRLNGPISSSNPTPAVIASAVSPLPTSVPAIVDTSSAPTAIIESAVIEPAGATLPTAAVPSLAITGPSLAAPFASPASLPDVSDYTKTMLNLLGSVQQSCTRQDQLINNVFASLRNGYISLDKKRRLAEVQIQELQAQVHAMQAQTQIRNSVPMPPPPTAIMANRHITSDQDSSDLIAGAGFLPIDQEADHIHTSNTATADAVAAGQGISSATQTGDDQLI